MKIASYIGEIEKFGKKIFPAGCSFLSDGELNIRGIAAALTLYKDMITRGDIVVPCYECNRRCTVRAAHYRSRVNLTD